MRDIKFKIFDKNIKIMYQPEKIHNIYFCDGKSADIVTNGLIPHDYDDVELLQFTGLKDKNGIEIYESDVVEIDNGKGCHKFKIVYHDGGFKVARIQERLKIVMILDVPCRNSDISVIGNIYETKEFKNE